MNIKAPTIEDMITALIEAADARRWNHLEADTRKHRHDWQRFGVELTIKEYQELPKFLAQHSHCALYAYQHDTSFAWGYYRRQLNVSKWKLYDVLAVYHPEAMEIIHVMRADARYFEKKAKLMKTEKPKRLR